MSKKVRLKKSQVNQIFNNLFEQGVNLPVKDSKNELELQDKIKNKVFFSDSPNALTLSIDKDGNYIIMKNAFTDSPEIVAKVRD